MIDFLAWLLVVEVLGLAFLPLTVWLFRWLPDRGYIFAKVLGLLLVTYLTWIIGSILPVAGGVALPAVALLAGGGLGWWRWHGQTVRALREVGRVAAVEEVLFVGGLFVWSVLRAQVFGPSINHTEQFMDLMFLNASIKSASYPPYDAWMSGHTVNYYYFGYLMFGTLIKLSGVAPAVGYNLSLSFLFASVVSGAYSLGYALTRRLIWPILAPVFIALLGNWHALLWEIPHHGLAAGSSLSTWGALFDSTRIIGNHYTLADWNLVHGPGIKYVDYTINEFPLFSLVLGDLHPHVMALAPALLALAAGCAILLAPGGLTVERERYSLFRIALLACIIGSLFTINSWDFPTYLLAVSACIAVKGFITDTSPAWWKQPLKGIIVLGATSLVLFAPFYLHFRSLAHGLGSVTTPTDPYEFAQVLGFPILACLLLVGSLSWLLRPIAKEEEEEEVVQRERQPASAGGAGECDSPLRAPAEDTRAGLTKGGEAGSATLSLILGLMGIVLLGGVLHRWLLLVLLVLGIWAVMILLRVLNTERPNLSDAAALVLIGVAIVLLVFTELYYVRDSFDGSGYYRMNTVFKFYYHAWVLLGVAGAYAAFRGWQVVRNYFGPGYAWGAMAVVLIGGLGAGVATRYIGSYASGTSAGSLDGMAWFKDAQHGDYAAIQWFRSHVNGHPVELEAEGPEYLIQGPFGRISTFTGLPTVMGWAGHEDQWRPGNSEINVRVSDVHTMYSSGDTNVVRRLMRKYGVRYVVVGTQEHQAYGGNPAGLAKFGRFMKVAYRSGSTTVYTW